MLSLQSLELEFDKFDIEDDSTCKWDSLTITLIEDNDEEQLLHRLCAHSPPENPIIVDGPGVVKFEFISDGFYHFAGFHGSYEVSTDEPADFVGTYNNGKDS